LRQAYFSSFTLFPFYLPLALLGVPPLVYATHAALSLLYQFWIHTELIDRLPRPLEWILNTPSHHRVHHGINREYLDKNYGATLIIWDRLFGTFEPEVAPVVFGVTKPIQSFNPTWANFEYFVQLASLAKRAPTFGTRLRVATAPPGWNPETREVELPSPVSRDAFVKYAAPEASPGVKRWLVAQVGALSLALMVLLLFIEVLPLWALSAGAVLIVLSSLAWSGILERRRWGWPLELGRLVASVGLGVWLVVSI